MGDRRATEALPLGQTILDRLPQPDHPEHHFVFDDHDKYEFYWRPSSPGSARTWFQARKVGSGPHFVMI